jgi:AraC-like DNA-binding protein
MCSRGNEPDNQIMKNEPDGNGCRRKRPGREKRNVSSTQAKGRRRKRKRASKVNESVDLEAEADAAGYCADTMAENLGVGVRQLRRRIRALRGEVTQAWVKRVRMENADKELRADPNLLIQDLAKRLMYSRASSLTHAFKEFYHKPPRVVRGAGSATGGIAVLNL